MLVLGRLLDLHRTDQLLASSVQLGTFYLLHISKYQMANYPKVPLGLGPPHYVPLPLKYTPCKLQGTQCQSSQLWRVVVAQRTNSAHQPGWRVSVVSVSVTEF